MNIIETNLDFGKLVYGNKHSTCSVHDTGWASIQR